MAKRKPYTNPPLLELFCEFSFQPNLEKESLLPYPVLLTKLWKKLNTHFPHAVQPLGPPTPRDRFASEDGKTLLQVAENLLAVNRMPPYDEWGRYESVVEECFREYTRHWKPARVDRAAVRYVSKIDIPRPEVNLEEYLNLFPVLPEFPKKPATNIAVSYEVQGVQEGDVVLTSLRQYPSADPEGTTFLMLWHYAATGGLPADTQQVQSWLGKAHDFLGELVRSTFTDESLRLFD